MGGAALSIEGLWADGVWIWFIFFFQAEDGIRDLTVTGVQTCALPICRTCILVSTDLRENFLSENIYLTPAYMLVSFRKRESGAPVGGNTSKLTELKIGRASCRERV